MKKKLLLTTIVSLGAFLAASKFYHQKVTEELKIEGGQINNGRVNNSVVQTTPQNTDVMVTSKSKMDINKEEFYKSIHNTLFKEAYSLDVEKNDEQLSELNKRGIEGAKVILEDLKNVPTDDEQVRLRLSLVDYLVYRMKFDPETRSEVVKTLTSIEMPEKLNIYHASLISDSAELMAGLSQYDLNNALESIKQMKDKRIKFYAADSVAKRLYDTGMNHKEAIAMVSEAVEEYRSKNPLKI